MIKGTPLTNRALYLSAKHKCFAEKNYWCFGVCFLNYLRRGISHGHQCYKEPVAYIHDTGIKDT